MALSDLILLKGKIIVTQGTSTTGVVSVEGGLGLNFGIVQKVYDTCDTIVVGQTGIFNPEKSIPFMVISGTVFYIIEESDIRIKEPIAP